MRQGRRTGKPDSGGGDLRRWLVRSVWLGLLLGLALPSAQGLASSSAASPSAVWGGGLELALPANGATAPNVTLNAVSCPSAGNCAAVGQYLDSSGNWQALVVTESSGTWGKGIEVPLPANAATSNLQASLNSVSCPSAGNCAAVGDYGDTSGNGLPLAVTETSGTWGQGVAVTLPANAVADGSQDASLDSVSCGSVGSCSAVGSYVDISGNGQGLLANAASGAWAPGAEAILPGNAASNPSVDLNSVSCAAAGSCTAVGDYLDGASNSLALAVTETSVTWGHGVEVGLPGNAATSAQDASLNEVSCASAGNCSAGGVYVDGSTNTQGLLANQVGGAWAGGVEAHLPANAAATSQDAEVNSVSCASVGNCSAVGDYVDSAGNGLALVVTESSGTWGQGGEASLPENAAGSSQQASLGSVSCASAGSCSAVGYYVDGAGNGLALAVIESSGTWAPGVQVGLPSNAIGGGSQDASLDAVSCASTVSCSAVGDYVDHSKHGPGLLVSSAPPPTQGQSSDGAPIEGTVTVNGVPLSGTKQIPFGAVVDATSGTISITTTVDGHTQTATFAQGVFVLKQTKNGLTIATLVHEKASLCKASKKSKKKKKRHTAAFSGKPSKGKKSKKSSKILDKIVTSGHGSFQSKGKYAAGAAHGTTWLVEDRCDGTFIHVFTDVVTVHDFVTHKTFHVKAGHSYLASPHH